jgi:hypothetical protein
VYCGIQPTDEPCLDRDAAALPFTSSERGPQAPRLWDPTLPVGCVMHAVQIHEGGWEIASMSQGALAAWRLAASMAQGSTLGCPDAMDTRHLGFSVIFDPLPGRAMSDDRSGRENAIGSNSIRQNRVFSNARRLSPARNQCRVFHACSAACGEAVRDPRSNRSLSQC